ncbi:glycosyltransferase family 2 protein [Rhodocytophaga rosea]|uniref:Glycosyltransferase family 2 protein n=2 Tax=Rhodocytophaga rosea TaxID=2704465 RepID=A0A6C0GW17_9BACT|nr:glycosyltransferase family 2 protein [Rhodocytophaga rosea]
MSIIIPVFNESGTIEKLIFYLADCIKDYPECEIIVSDGNSTDDTFTIAEQAGAKVIRSIRKGRAAQMNAGALVASGEILYFLHADSFPPAGFYEEIIKAVKDGYGSGCYQLAFDYAHWFLRANAWFTRFNMNAIRFGDQSLFVQKEIFVKAGGFDESLVIMEDQEIIARIKKLGRFIVLPGAITTSARKYLENGIYKLQGIFFLIYFLYKLGVDQKKLVNLYRKLIRQQKV